MLANNARNAQDWRVTTGRLRHRWFYLSAIASFLAVRIVSISFTEAKEVYTPWSTATDARVYDRFGWNLAHQGTLGVGEVPSAFALPAYPLLLAGVYRVTGHLPGAVRWVQLLFGLLAAMALARLARCLGGPRSEILLLAATAIYPFFIYFVAEILTEGLFLCAFSGMLLTSMRMGRKPTLHDGLLHGACLAVGVLTRPVALLLEPGVLLLARPWAQPGRVRRLSGFLLGFSVVSLAWGSWAMRNRAVFGETVLLDTHGGFALYLGQLTSRGLPPEVIDRRMEFNHDDVADGTLPGGPREELARDRRAGAAVRKLIRDDPGTLLATLPRNILALWLGMDFSEVAHHRLEAGIITLVGLASYGPVLVLGLMGLFRSYRQRRRRVLGCALWILLSTTLLHAVVLGGKRYRVASIDPVLLVLACWEVDCRVPGRFRRDPPGNAP